MIAIVILSPLLHPLLALFERFVDKRQAEEQYVPLDRPTHSAYEGEEYMHAKFVLLFLVVSLILAVGCTPTPGESAATLPATTPATEENNMEPTNPPDSGAPALSSGETPQELFDAVVDDMLARSGGDRSAIEVVKSEAVEWSDGSLGCPQPDMMYTQAIVPGYHVILALGDETYDYRLSDRGAFVLCENPLPGGATESAPTE
jgi:hypothetical protein